MKRIVIHILIYSSLLTVGFFALLATADGATDPFYLRFTTPQKSNLILGTSRAAQGLQPSVFKKNFEKEFFNYAFTLPHSPFGETYLNSIKMKLDTTVRDGIFIVTVDPWSIASSGENPNDPLLFQERHLCLGTTSNVNTKPNFEYLIENFKGKYYKLFKPKSEDMFLHKDGWLEVNHQINSIDRLKYIELRVAEYKKEKLPLFNFSETRLNQLAKTVTYLKKYGRVYLVRLPVHKLMYKVDQTLIPDFNEKINPIILLSDGYFDLTPLNSNFEYTDGNHLEKNSGAIVSLKIAQSIQNLSKIE
ncbi:MAG: hypothetical protein WDZ45_05365 [Flavobacteriaceae bacterium]